LEELLAHSPMRVSAGGEAACRGAQGFKTPARQQLGHDDYKSIEAYIAIVRNGELALQ
jgi:hypothetical protein